MTKKYSFPYRLLILFPLVLLASVVWAIIGLIDEKALGKVLKQTGENLLK